MKKLLLFLAALLLCSSAWAAQKVQVMTDGKIDVDRLPTISFFQENDPASPELGQIWWNNATNQLKVAGAAGVYSFTGTLAAWDTTPEAFSFTDVTDATISTVYASDPITVSGINWPAAISVSGDASAKYSVNNATAVSTNGTVESGDTVSAVVTSSASSATAVNATVTIGGVSDAYDVTTTAETVSCSGNYGEMVDGGAWGTHGSNLITVAKVPICENGVPTLKIYLSTINGSTRSVIPVVYEDDSNNPGSVIWIGESYYNQSVGDTPVQISFATNVSMSGGYVWVGVLAQDTNTYTRKKVGTGEYRTYTVSSFGSGYIPEEWPTESDGEVSTAILSIGLSY